MSIFFSSRLRRNAGLDCVWCSVLGIVALAVLLTFSSRTATAQGSFLAPLWVTLPTPAAHLFRALPSGSRKYRPTTRVRSRRMKQGPIRCPLYLRAPTVSRSAKKDFAALRHRTSS